MQQIPETVRDAIESIRLPSIPHVLLRFLNVVEDDRASMAELALLVGQDPALSARFLTVANSPALRRETGNKSLEQCLVALGTRLSRTLAACLAIQSVFMRIAGEPRYDFTGFWRHSLRVAEIAREFAVKTNYGDVEEAYLAALLHDAGQLLLLGGVGERYGDLLKCSNDEALLFELEKPALGTDHAEAGAWLIDQWKLPSFMADAVLFHHRTVEEIGAAGRLCQIVWCSHIVSNHYETPPLPHNGKMSGLAAVPSILGIGPVDIAAVQNQSSERVALLATALGIAGACEAKTVTIPFLSFNSSSPGPGDGDPAHSRIDEMVSDMAMMQVLQRDLSELSGEGEILFAVRESARILFGLERIAFLFVKPDKAVLSGPDFGGQPELLMRLEVNLEPAHSLAAAAASGEKACSTFDEQFSASISLIDIQIARAMESEGLLYLPMRGSGQLVGVMVYGLAVSKYARIQRHLAWMTNFAHMAAECIEACRKMRGLEQKLEQKLTSRFEQRARKVVHEAGNPLGIIKNYLKIVSQKLPAGNGVHQELEILKEEIDRVTNILQQLGSLAGASPAMGAVDINGVIEGMLALYSESLFSIHGIAVEKTLDRGLATIRGDRDSIKQILFNLWKNAAEAMPDGGRFVISTRGNVVKNGRLHAEIRLRDSGPGLPQDVVERLFQPLDPDRRKGHCGIGLSIVASLVENLGGLITHQSNEGQGTCFYILLPQTGVDEK